MHDQSNKPLAYSYIWNYYNRFKDEIEHKGNYRYKPLHCYISGSYSRSWEDFEKEVGEPERYEWDDALYFYHKSRLKIASTIGFKRTVENKIDHICFDNVRKSIIWLLDFYEDPNKGNSFFEFNGLDKDSEIEKTLYSILSGKKSTDNIREIEARITRKERQITDSFSKLLLRRYHLDCVKDIEISFIHNKFTGWLFKWIPTERNLLINFLILLVIIIFFVSTLSNFPVEWGAPIPGKTIFPLAFSDDFRDVDSQGNSLTFEIRKDSLEIYLEWTVFIIFFLILFFLIKHQNTIRLWIPRLFGSIIVGYLPLIVGDELWKFAILADRYTITAIVFLSLFISFLYILHEISNIVGYGKDVFRRSVNIFSNGVLYSFSIGIILLDILNAHFVSNMNDPQIFRSSHLHSGILGVIDPKVLLVFFPLALLIGIFVQIIWDDKPITEPL